MTCKNCQKTLVELQKYCDNCGAKVIRNRLTPKVILNQINEQFFSLDNRLLRTFIDLFKKPEAVINSYVNGTRKKYTDTLQYFGLALTLAGFQVFLMLTFFKDSLGMDFEFIKGFQNVQSQENPFLDSSFENSSKYQGLIYIFTLPLSAFSTWFAYYIVGDRRYNFTEHFVLNTYYSAQIIIVTAILSILFLMLGINYLIVSFILLIPMLLYLGYVLLRVFRDSFAESFGKFILTMVIYSITYGLIAGAIGIAGYIIGRYS